MIIFVYLLILFLVSRNHNIKKRTRFT